MSFAEWNIYWFFAKPELLVDGTENIFDCKCRKWRMIIEVGNQPTGSPHFVRFLDLLKNRTKWNSHIVKQIWTFFVPLFTTRLEPWFELYWPQNLVNITNILSKRYSKLESNLFPKNSKINQKILQKWHKKSAQSEEMWENRTMWIFFEKIQTSHKVKFAHSETAQSEGYLYIKDYF